MLRLTPRGVRTLRTLVSAPVILVLYTLVRVLLFHRRIRIVVMDPRYFGHQCLEPEVFWNDWQLSVESGSHDFWLCSLGKKSMASNRYLWEIAARRLHTVPSWLVSEIKAIKKHLALPGIELQDASIYRLNFLPTRRCSLPSGSQLSSRRASILHKFVEPTRPYVIFTIRDPRVIYDLHDPRNREIREFLPSMEMLTMRGYNVIRLTSRTSDLITSLNPHILDWQVQVDGEPGDELALMSEASFVVSSTTGGDCLALAYRKPVLYIDCARFYLAFLGTELATLHMPRMFDIGSGDPLGMAEILKRGLGWVGDYRSFERAGVRIENSSPIEISRAVSEFMSAETEMRLRIDSPSQLQWRELLNRHHGTQILPRHGKIRANMLGSAIDEFVRG